METSSLTGAHAEKHLVVLLAGRASEELVFGEGVAGAGGHEDSDLARATKLATRMETSYGLGSFGLLCVDSDRVHDLLMFGDLQAAVRRALDRAYASALDLITKHRRTLDALADALFKSNYLDRSEIEGILTNVPLKEAVAADMQSVQTSPSLESSDADIDAVVDGPIALS